VKVVVAPSVEGDGKEMGEGDGGKEMGSIQYSCYCVRTTQRGQSIL